MNNDPKNEILDILQEECAEVIQAISKIKRFGWDSSFEDINNRDRLIKELGDVTAMIDLLVAGGAADVMKIRECAKAKKEKLRIWSSIVVD